MTYNLEAQYDSRKSFYGKATVTESHSKSGYTKKLTSYSTEVALISNGKARVHGVYSATTLRHIKEFLLQNGFKAINKAQILKDYHGKD